MKPLLTMVTALVRPRHAFGAMDAGAIRWIWIVPLVLLAASAMAKGAVNAPLVFTEQQEALERRMSGPVGTEMSGEEAPKDVEIAQPMLPEEEIAVVSTVATTSAIVFAGIGSVAAVVLAALFFFIAAKVSAKELRYTAPLTVVSIGLLPHALRNVVQTLYISATGSPLTHAGLGALVAPADVTEAPPLSYAVLSQIDLWVIWGLLILFGGLTSSLIGLERKRALTAFSAFVAIVFVLQAVPVLIQGAFIGMGG